MKVFRIRQAIAHFDQWKPLISKITIRSKSKKVVHTIIIKDWFTQYCEDAPDFKGCKKCHFDLPVFSKKIWKKLKSFKLRLQIIFQFLAET